MHWRDKHRAKNRYWAKLDNLQLIGEIPPPPEQPWTKAEARVHWYVRNLMDVGNAYARLKFCEDWLVTRGYLVDDRQANLTYPEQPAQTVTRKKPELCVEIELERVE